LFIAEHSTPTTRTTNLENRREKDKRTERDIGGKRGRQTNKETKRVKVKFLKQQDAQRNPNLEKEREIEREKVKVKERKLNLWKNKTHR